MIKTLLLTDVVNSTALTEELGDKRMSNIWIKHDQIARDLLNKYEGQEADRTDGFLMLFDSVKNAGLYAVEFHKALADLTQNEGIDFKSRIGIHTGEIILLENITGQEFTSNKPIAVEGIAKPTTARIMSTARGGQTLMSEASFNELDEHQFVCESHGFWRMKGLAQPIELFEVGDHSNNFFPPENSSKAYRVNWINEIWSPVHETPNNLARERDRFIGRSKELRHLKLLFQKSQTQLVTLLGPGGIGKTRLSKRFGSMWLGDYTGGIWFCDLSEAQSVDGIFFAVAKAFGVPLTKVDVVNHIGNIIAGHGQCLLIIDNFEQVIAYAKDTIKVWMDQAPQAQFLVTSRFVLDFSGEMIFNLKPLPVSEEGVLLFESRAQERRAEFKLLDDNINDVMSIVETLDGLPLAIELAASRIAVLQPRQIKERLKDRFKLLTGAKGVAKRQQTLLAAIDWSWALLSEWEKSTLAQCSVFEGGIRLESAEDVIDLSPYPDAPAVMDVLQNLVDKSLIRREVQPYDSNEPWFGMYLSIRAYAEKKIQASDEFTGGNPSGLKALRKRHADHFARFGQEEYTEKLDTKSGIKEGKIAKSEIDNILSALHFSIDQKEVENASLLLRAASYILNQIGPVYLIKSPAEEVMKLSSENPKSYIRAGLVLTIYHSFVRHDAGSTLQFVERVLNKSIEINDLNAVARLNFHIGKIHGLMGNANQAIEYAKTSISLAKKIGNERVEAISNSMLSRVYVDLGMIKESEDCIQVVLKIARKNGLIRLEAIALNGFGIICMRKASFEEAKEIFEQVIELNKHSNVGGNTSDVAFNLGETYAYIGKYEQARKIHLELLKDARKFGNKHVERVTLCAIGNQYAEQGNYDLAIEYNLKGIQLLEESSLRMLEMEAKGNYASILIKMEDYSGARAIANGNLVRSRNLNIRKIESNSLSLLGVVSICESKFDEAEIYFKEAAEIVTGLKLEAELNLLRMEQGYLFGLQGKFDEAIEQFKLSEQYYSAINNKPVLAQILIKWAKVNKLFTKEKLAKEKLDSANLLIDEFELKPQSWLIQEVEMLKMEIS